MANDSSRHAADSKLMVLRICSKVECNPSGLQHVPCHQKAPQMQTHAMVTNWSVSTSTMLLFVRLLTCEAAGD